MLNGLFIGLLILQVTGKCAVKIETKILYNLNNTSDVQGNYSKISTFYYRHYCL